MDGRITNLEQIASVRRYTITDGKGAGLRVIDCDNGTIRFLLNESKALDMMQLYYKGQNVSFVSKNAFTAREVDFLSRFEGGMIYTCGLDSVGGREGHELHGNLHNTPAEVFCAECSEKGIVIEARVRVSQLFGENLVLCRKVSAAVGADTVTVEDTLTNEGHKDASYALLYHINVGYPMLDEGAVLRGDIQNAEARNDWAQKNIATYREMSLPTPDGEETCYYLTLGTPSVTLENPKLGRSFTVAYSGDALTHFLEWKSMVSGDYALGLEPTTTRLDDGFATKTLGAGESTSFCVSLSVRDIK